MKLCRLTANNTNSLRQFLEFLATALLRNFGTLFCPFRRTQLTRFLLTLTNRPRFRNAVWGGASETTEETHKLKTAKPEIGFRLFEYSAYLPLELKPPYVLLQKGERIRPILDTDVKMLYTQYDVLHTYVKAIPLQAWTGPEGSRRLSLPDFKTIGT